MIQWEWEWKVKGAIELPDENDNEERICGVYTSVDMSVAMFIFNKVAPKFMI